MNLITIADIPEHLHLYLVTDSQDTDFIRERYAHVEDINEYDSFFTNDDGEPIYGFLGVVPYLDDLVWKI